ncbi:Signal peptidase I (SPase I) (Leader peptidase I) [Bradyrhizobium sp. STM 3843]|nr:Signal peptidase I (SPase I) (Leader peptidase I) [Bradyrhizobium sp. STM 3843]
MTGVEAGAIRSKREPWWSIAAVFVLGFVLLSLLTASPLLVRAFLYQPFNIPAGSMKPTFLVGDVFFVAKYPYGYSRYTWPLSWPSSLAASARIWGAVPARGDVVAFFLPKDNATVYIKRVVGLPGDRIQMKDGRLYINETPVVRERRDDAVGLSACGDESRERVKRWRETLPNGVSYDTLDCLDNGFFDNTPVYTVPPDRLFMLGDNRDNSTDSRVLSQVGYVPIENVIGRAAMIYFSVTGGEKGEPGRIRFERIGMMVR